MAVKCNTFLVGKILTTKWYKPRYLPFNHQFHLWFCYDWEKILSLVSTEQEHPVVSFHWTRGFSCWS